MHLNFDCTCFAIVHVLLSEATDLPYFSLRFLENLYFANYLHGHLLFCLSARFVL